MPRINVKKAIENSSKLIKKDNRYDMNMNDANEIRKMSLDDWEGIYNGFRFGYMQGYKAAMNEMQSKEAV